MEILSSIMLEEATHSYRSKTEHCSVSCFLANVAQDRWLSSHCRTSVRLCGLGCHLLINILAPLLLRLRFGCSPVVVISIFLMLILDIRQ